MFYSDLYNEGCVDIKIRTDTDNNFHAMANDW